MSLEIVEYNEEQPIDYSEKWDERFMGVARQISTWSKDPSTKVGAIAVKDRRILAQGYNGYPAGLIDYEEDDRTSKYEKTIHAEANVIYNACNYGIRLNNSTVYIYGMYPCPECVKGLAQVDVDKIVFQLGTSSNLQKWKNSFDVSRVLLRDLCLQYIHYREVE